MDVTPDVWREAVEEKAQVHAASQGDREAFSCLVGQYQARLISSAFQIVGNAEDAKDLSQESLIEAYRRLPELKDPSRFRPWLFVILRNKCFRHLQRLRPTVPLDACQKVAAPVSVETSITDYLQSMSLSDREILAARYLQDMDYGEIAEVLGISINAATLRCARARERLRKIVQKAEEAEARRLLTGVCSIALAGIDPTTFTHRVMQEVNTMTQSIALTSTSSFAATTLGITGKGILAIGIGWKIAIGTIIVLGMIAIGLGMAPIGPGGGPIIQLFSHQNKASKDKQMQQQDYGEYAGSKVFSDLSKYHLTPETEQSAENLLQLSKAVRGYAQDHNGILPPLDITSLQAILNLPPSVWRQPGSGLEYRANMSISGKSIGEIKNPQTVLFYEAPWPSGTRQVAYIDGTGGIFADESSWNSIKIQSGIK